MRMLYRLRVFQMFFSFSIMSLFKTLNFNFHLKFYDKTGKNSDDDTPHISIIKDEVHAGSHFR